VLLLAAGCAAVKPGLGPLELTTDVPPPDLASELERARALIDELRYKEGTAVLGPLMKRFEARGEPARAAEAGFWAGYCHEKQGHILAARRFYVRVIEQHRGTRPARQARERFARLPAP
jgi:hypothetical protein